MYFSLQGSIFRMLVFTVIMIWLSLVALFELRVLESLSSLLSLLFPSAQRLSGMLFGCFLGIASLNLLRLVCYRFPVTTTLSFNLAAALSL